MITISNIAIIILAAGGSSRMRQPKQLLPWGKTTLLGHSIQQALKSNTKKVYVVLGAYFNEIELSIREEPIDILKNNDWETGMGSSIALGIKCIQKENFDGALFMLADQPQIDSVFLNKIIATWWKSKNSIIATAHKNTVGVPAIFDKDYFNELSKLIGKKGASSIINHNLSKTTIVHAAKPIIDIDTKEEYEAQFNLVH
ncbi:MAG: nucleotidyltransferase family protein [Cyclobacteriaceae bacterium]|nr:nucleotidyltransferase family protein [Cyclobacteriaceae bacterium]